MLKSVLNPLEYREVFHLEFLRRLGGKLDPKAYALKGGVNLRLFFGSVRCSEDLDLDVAGWPVNRLRETVMAILKSPSLADTLGSYGVRDIRPPHPARAKQTETTQRFKVHLFTAAGEELFTKVEFSRRGLGRGTAVELVPEAFLRRYGLSTLWVPHYDLASALRQKVEALASRTAVQARDIFDLHLLLSQPGARETAPTLPGRSLLRQARERVFEVGFDVFRDTVLSYLALDDRKAFDRPEAWDGLRLQVAEFLENPGVRHG